MLTVPAMADNTTNNKEVSDNATAASRTETAQSSTNNNDETLGEKVRRRLTVGGYGEAVMSRNFYSDNYMRYTDAASFKNAKSHGRFDLPHVVIFLGYDFGKGWSLGSEIEFEHGGIEAATEVETEEAGEYEYEIERGGEVGLEQFWIQKSFMPQLNIRAGHIIVPVGQTNNHHLPTEFFGVYRPEGENTIMPCTWHETGISVWGQTKLWNSESSLRYEALFISGLNSDQFGNQGWIHNGSASPYEFKVANSYAGAARLDFMPIRGIRLSLSGYIGNSFRNTLYPTENSKNDGIKGTVTIGAFDFAIDRGNWIVRGSADYGHLSDAAHISRFNIGMPNYNGSPSHRQYVASDAYALGIEAGYNFFGLSSKLTRQQQRMYLFGRYDSYDSQHKMESGTPRDWCGRQRVAVGFNYYPMREIVVKGEYAIGLLSHKYNNEPSVSLGIAYSGTFL